MASLPLQWKYREKTNTFKYSPHQLYELKLSQNSLAELTAQPTAGAGEGGVRK